MPILTLVSGCDSDAVVNGRMPILRAYCRPVPGMTCISPRALADDRISAVKVDSCAISAETRYGSRLFALEYFSIRSQ